MADFDESYWTERSKYRKFEDYDHAHDAIRRWHAGMWRMLTSYMPPPGRHVDAGCGHGTVVFDLLERGWDAHGFDRSEWIITQTRNSVGDQADRFAIGVLDALPFAGEFDLITCFEVLEHVPDPVSDLKALRERLRPGGRLIATTPNLHPRMPWFDPVAADPTHVSVHAPAWWRNAVGMAGLKATRVSTFIALPLLWRLHPLLSRWVPLGSRTGPGVLIVADA